MFKNRVLRKTFGPKKKEVTGGRRKLHNKKLHDFYCSSNIIKKDEMGEAHGKYGAEAKCLKGFDGETKDRHQFEGPATDKTEWTRLIWLTTSTRSMIL